MSFVSFDFILFLTITVVLYFIIPKKFKFIVLLLANTYFYFISCGFNILYLIISIISIYIAGILMTKYKNKKKSFAEVIKNFTERDRNNDIVVEVLKLDLPELGGEGKGKKEKADPISYDNAEAKEEPAPSAKAKGAVTGKGDKKAAGAKSIVSTDFIIDGDTQVLINIVKEKSK